MLPDPAGRARVAPHHASSPCAEIGAEPRVATVAELVKAMNYNNKQLLAAMIVAGWDDAEGGVVYGAPIGGTLVSAATCRGTMHSHVARNCQHLPIHVLLLLATPRPASSGRSMGPGPHTFGPSVTRSSGRA